MPVKLKRAFVSALALSPYGFFDEKHQAHGDLFDIAQAILKHGNFQGKVVIEPLNRLAQSILVEKILDCSIYGTVPSVTNNYQISESTGIHVKFGILPRQGVSINSYADLRNLKIGLPLGVNIGGPFDKDDSLNKITAKNYETGMLMLKHRRFDAIAGVIGSLQFSGKKQGVDAEIYGKAYITKTLPMVVACRPGFLDEYLSKQLAKSIIELRENGTFQNIFDSYRKK